MSSVKVLTAYGHWYGPDKPLHGEHGGENNGEERGEHSGRGLVDEVDERRELIVMRASEVAEGGRDANEHPR